MQSHIRQEVDQAAKVPSRTEWSWGQGVLGVQERYLGIHPEGSISASSFILPLILSSDMCDLVTHVPGSDGPEE